MILIIGSIFFILVVVSVVMIAMHFSKARLHNKRVMQKQNVQEQKNERDECAVKNFNLIIKEISPKARARAMQIVLLKNPLPLEQEKKLRQEFGGKVFRTPLLSDSSILLETPSLMSSPFFLKAINQWLVASGKDEVTSFSAADIKVGEALVSSFTEEARTRVKEFEN